MPGERSLTSLVVGLIVISLLHSAYTNNPPRTIQKNRCELKLVADYDVMMHKMPFHLHSTV